MHKKQMTKEEFYNLVNKDLDKSYKKGDTLVYCSIHTTCYRVTDGCIGWQGFDLENNEFQKEQFEYNIQRNCFAPITLV